MDDVFEGFGSGSTQDDLDLASLRYFQELDRQADGDAPPPQQAPAAPSRPPLEGDLEAEAPDLSDGGLDSLILQLMVDAVPAPRKSPPPRRTTRPLGRPVPRKKAAEAPAPPAPARKEAPAPAAPATGAPLSDLALRAARLFDRLPTQDQLLALTLLEKLDKAAER